LAQVVASLADEVYTVYISNPGALMTSIKLTCAEYQRLRDEAAEHLTIFAKAQLLAGELPHDNLRLRQAWDIFATAMLEEYGA
tara:strand:+ start:369 stop:617 length:249 start_codon:yes stop_codon:yes gene_type:complete